MPDYINLGTKPQKSEIATASPSNKRVESYPEFYVENITLPISSDDVGKEITAMVKLRVKKAGDEIDYENKKKYRASFCVLGINFNKKKMVDIKNASEFDLDQMEEEEFELGKGKKRNKGGLYATN